MPILGIVAPQIPMPTTEGKFYEWSEGDLSWKEITND